VSINELLTSFVKNSRGGTLKTPKESILSILATKKTLGDSHKKGGARRLGKLCQGEGLEGKPRQVSGILSSRDRGKGPTGRDRQITEESSSCR